MERNHAMRWVAHRINNPQIYTDFDFNFISNYLKFIKDYEISAEQVKVEMIKRKADFTVNIKSYISSLMDHVALTFNINCVFSTEKGKLLKIY